MNYYGELWGKFSSVSVGDRLTCPGFTETLVRKCMRIDRLILSDSKVFHKCSSRIQEFHDLAIGIPLSV